MYFSGLADLEEITEMDNADLLTIIQHKHLQISSEDRVLEAVLNWVLADKQTREGHFAKLLQYVRINHCSNALLGFIGKQRNPELKFMKREITRKLKYLNGINDTAPNSIPSLRSSVGQESVFLIGGDDPTAGRPNIHLYVAPIWPEKNKHTFMKMGRVPWEQRVAEFGVTLVVNGFVLTGGRSDVSMRDTYFFNFRHLDWTRLPELLTPRHGHASATHGSLSVLVVGGAKKTRDPVTRQSTTEALYSVDILDMLDMKWSRVTNTPGRCSDATVCGHKLYMYEHQSGTTTGSVLHEYDLKEGSWAQRAPIQGDTNGIGLINVLDRLYCVGGFDRMFRVYSAMDDTWTELDQVIPSVRHGAATFCRDTVFFAGGVEGDSGLDMTVDEYSIKEKRWHRKRGLNLPGYCQHHRLFGSKHFANV